MSGDSPASRAISVVHISGADNWGGSGRSAYRIHRGLKQLGLESRMLVGMKTTDDPDVDLISSRWVRVADRACHAITTPLNLQYLFYPSSFWAARHRWIRRADVLQVYNTHGGYFSYTALPLLSRARPVVWRLSDMWPLTGHCAYAYDCERWRTGCGTCPLLDVPPALTRDTTALLWRIKRFVYSRARLVLVAPSRWMAGLVRNSPLLSSFPLHVIYNGVDTTIFRPMPREAARAVLDLPVDRFVILFSAQFLADPRKGGTIVREVLARLQGDGLGNALVLAVGAGASEWSHGSGVPFPVRSLEHVNSDQLMAACYAAANVFVFPTLAENLPNGVLESMACGTPPVAFDVGGCPEAVRHMETGYLSRYQDLGDMVRGVLALQDAALAARLGSAGRRLVENEFEFVRQAREHADLYREMLRA